MSFLEALNGSRYIALVILPLAIVGGYLLYEFVRERLLRKSIDKECLIRILFLISSGIGAGLGYITYSIMTNYFSTYANSALGFLAIQDTEPGKIIFFDRIKEMIYLWFKLWGFELNGQNMASLAGIETVICIALSIGTVILSIKRCMRSENNKIRYFACFAIISLSTTSFLMAIMKTIIPTTRYYYFVLYYMFFLLIIYFSTKKIKTILASFFDTLLIITSLCFVLLTQFTMINNIKERWKTETLGIMTATDYREDINKWLEQNGYQFGYATYWNANVGTVLSNCEEKFAAMYIGNDMDLYPFFGGMVREYCNSANYKGKTFILLTHDEDSQVKENLPDGYVEAYNNDMFIVYGYEENPYDFSAELLQYFPVKDETIILESGNFFTQGNKNGNNIIFENNDEGGYLVYGLDIRFPVDATYNIEYNFTVNKMGSAPSGYIAVLANGTEEIVRKEIVGGGEISMTLEDVPIFSNGVIADLVVYLNGGCDAVFKDIRITRVR